MGLLSGNLAGVSDGSHILQAQHAEKSDNGPILAGSDIKFGNLAFRSFTTRFIIYQLGMPRLLKK